MSDHQDEQVTSDDVRARRRRARSIAIALALAAFVAIFYFVTIAKIGSNIASRGL
ncbi:MAG: hypothetical protein KDJ88_16260 [Bauldia sp.]|nr:hypothetical protein [Bauldia sp.]